MGYFNNNNNSSSNEEINVANLNFRENLSNSNRRNLNNILNRKRNNKTIKSKKKVSWKNNNTVHNMNYNYPEERRESRKSIKKGDPNNANLSKEDLKIVKEVLKRNSRFTPQERKKLRKEIVQFLKEKSKKYNLHHLEEFEKDFLEFEATRNSYIF